MNAIFPKLVVAKLGHHLMTPVLEWLCIATCAVSLVACQNVSMGKKHAATAIMTPTSQSTVDGAVHFETIKDQLKIEVKLNGLMPHSVYGLHVHANGDCSALDASSAGGHFNPTNQVDTYSTTHHAGDLLDITADQYGVVNTVMYVKGLTIKADEISDIQGRSVVVDATPDDHQSQSARSAGQRIACGVIRVS
jgi:Cu-Zn family superoxide dismutase